jgi:hypothetical protein
MTKTIIRFKALKQLHEIALKISPVGKESSFSTTRTYHAEKILSRAVLTAHSYLRLSPPVYNESVDYHNYDISSLCSLSRNFIELSHVYNYMCKDKVSQEELEFRSYLMNVHYANEMKEILVALGFSNAAINGITFPGLGFSIGLLESNNFFTRLEPKIRGQLIKGGRAFLRGKEKTYQINKHIEMSLYKLFSNHTHSFWLGLGISYGDSIPINFSSLYFLSVETTLFYYANILKSYLSLRWKLAKKIDLIEKTFITECATESQIMSWIENQREIFKKGKTFF